MSVMVGDVLGSGLLHEWLLMFDLRFSELALRIMQFLHQLLLLLSSML